ncbi:MAG TPA: M20/M25/M40 family metallo-hydrolase, partial [Acetobacteraceae bacterium]|nr:M20/M25/M40 family metallo-hydrolase [Acetobacteraceae bacterium]
MKNGSLDAVLAHIDDNLDFSRERWFELLRIPSISAQPAHRQDCIRAATHMRDLLAEMGFEARLAETKGLPGVIARHHKAGSNAPHVLFYGHYDVQPPEPLELWESDPFNPQFKDGPRGKQVVARGAVDDKG